MKVWTVLHTSKYGDSVNVFSSGESANRFFVDSIREDWARWNDDSAPVSDDELIDAWSRPAEDMDGEEYFIECHEVKP